MNKRLLAVTTLGAVLALGAAACTDDNTADLSNWAKGVCDAAQSPIAQSRTALADTAKVAPEEAPADLQKRLSADLAALGKTNQDLADAIDKVGAPKVDDGATVQKDAVGELKQAAQGYQDAQKKLDGLPTTDQAKFADGLRSVGDQVQRLSQLSTQALGRLQSGTLGDAMKKQPGCKAAAPGAAPGTGGTDPTTAGSSSAGDAGTPSTGAATGPTGSTGSPAASPTGTAQASAGAPTGSASPTG
ncbi:small secreted protein [Kitasatospora sp. NPDC094015]|uniref:small secreted protein n=1 Tax=Kitasatospora sp. NPDC094015 TaxID=3155205 RepID=UPI00331E618C